MCRIRRHLTYANVISTLCLFLLLGGGTAVALSGSNTVFSDDIVNNQVRSADVRDDTLNNGGLQAGDLGPGSVGNSEVAIGAITSKGVLDESLVALDLAPDSVGSSEVAANALGSGEVIDGSLGAADLGNDSVGSSEVVNDSLTGADIADRSGVETCQAPLVVKLGPICAGSDGVARTWLAALSRCNGFGLRLPSVSEATNLSVNHNVPGVGSSERFWTDNEMVINNGFQANTVREDSGLPRPDPTDAEFEVVCVTDPSA
jgi:hypothetical protein